MGFPQGLSGADLARRATIQAQRFGVEILTAMIVPKHKTMSDPLVEATEVCSDALPERLQRFKASSSLCCMNPDTLAEQ